MKKVIVAVLLLCCFSTFSQRAVLGAGGGSMTVNNMYVSHSIGQQGVTGTFTNSEGVVLQQGFENYFLQVLSRAPLFSPAQVQTKVYPNPFFEELHFLFSTPLDTELTISVYDFSGKRMLTKTVQASSNVILSLASLPVGVYAVHLNGISYQYTSKVIKLQK